MKTQILKKRRNFFERNFYISKFFDTQSRIERYIMLWLELIDALIGILTLGILGSSMSVDFMFWSAERECKRRIAKGD